MPCASAEDRKRAGSFSIMRYEIRETPSSDLDLAFTSSSAGCVDNAGLLNKLLRKLPKVDKILASRALQICPQLIILKKKGGGVRRRGGEF